MLGFESVRSNHGDRHTAAAGSGSPASRSATSVAIARPPPAESPAKTPVEIPVGKISPNPYQPRKKVDPDQETLVVVVSFDAHGNHGVASNAACATPEEVDDFFEWYRELGGEAGGGYCNCSLVGAGRGTSQALFAILTVLAVAFGRRRRRTR